VTLNDQLKAAGHANRSGGLAAIRGDFEGAWVIWNIARAVVFTGAFACLARALWLNGGSVARQVAMSSGTSTGL
jgi:uncharacterized membrane protein